MEEQLVCSICQTQWNRIRTRGRKPIVCPDCISSGNTFIPTPQVSNSAIPNTEKSNDNQSSDFGGLSLSKIHSLLHPKPLNHQDMLESTKNGSKWKCPGCASIVTLLVPVTAVPTHKCTPNTVTVKLMERIS